MQPLISWVAIAFSAILLCTSHAHACMGAMLEHTIFFTKPPEPAFDADVIALITVQSVTPEGMMRATVNKVKQGPIAVGDVVTIEYQVSSCGPNHDAGENGLIIAKSAKSIDGAWTLYPYKRRLSDGHITKPNNIKGEPQ